MFSEAEGEGRISATAAVPKRHEGADRCAGHRTDRDVRVEVSPRGDAFGGDHQAHGDGDNPRPDALLVTDSERHGGDGQRGEDVRDVPGVEGTVSPGWFKSPGSPA